MKICTRKSDGKLIEMQSDATHGTLIKNAVTAGYNADDVEEREITPEEYAALTAPSASETRRAEIIAELASIDTASLRPLRAVAAGTATQFDTDKLVQLSARAEALRAELGVDH